MTPPSSDGPFRANVGLTLEYSLSAYGAKACNESNPPLSIISISRFSVGAAAKLALGTSEEAATAAPEYLIKLRRSMAFTFFGILGLQTE